MQDLNEKDKELLERLIKLSPAKINGYFRYTIGRKHFKRSRVVVQLYLNKKLEFWEIVHHKDGNRENDNLDNLEIIDTKNFNHHSSLHHAGKHYKLQNSKIFKV